MTYGLECLPLTMRELDPLEKYYRELLRITQHFPKSTAIPACYMMIGALPLEAQIHIKTLSLFGSMLQKDTSIEYRIIERQLALKDSNSHSWVIHVKKLLYLYDLPKPLEVLYSIIHQDSWKKCVKVMVRRYWTENLMDTARSMKTMAYINLQQLGLDPHHVWPRDTSDPLVIYRSTVHAKLIIQRYPLYTSHMSRASSTVCPCCHEAEETIEHFIVICVTLQHALAPHIPKIVNFLEKCHINANANTITRAALDPSIFTDHIEEIQGVIRTSRTMCFNLHLARLQHTKGPSQKSKAIKGARSVLNYHHRKTEGAASNGRELKRR